MAVLDDLPGIEVTVRVNCEPLKEYKAKNDEIQRSDPAIREHQAKKTVTKYIRAVTGANFTVNMDISRDLRVKTYAIGYSFRVDGQLLKCSSAKVALIKSHGHTSVLKSVASENSASGARNLRFLQFSQLKIETDDPSSVTEEEKSRVAEIGEIVVTLHRMVRGQFVKPKKAEKKTFEAYEDGNGGKVMADIEVQEKALKGKVKSHGTTLGDIAKTKHPYTGKVGGYYKVDYEDGWNYPIAIYRFKYVCRESLKQLGFIERTPEPEAVSDQALASAANNVAQPEVEPDLVDGLTAEDRAKLDQMSQQVAHFEQLSQKMSQEMEQLSQQLREKNRVPASTTKIENGNAKIKNEYSDVKVKAEDGGAPDGSRKRARKLGPLAVIDLTED